jgi:hypothetical protein
MSEFHDLDRRVAVLEQIAADTRDALREIRDDIRALRVEMRQGFDNARGDMTRGFDRLADRDWITFLWLLGVMLAGYAGLFTALHYWPPHP